MKSVSVRGVVLGEGRTKICVSVTGPDEAGLREELELVPGSGADLIEVRADLIREDPARALFLARESCPQMPVIFTVRTKREGGEFDGSAAVYRQLLLAAAGEADLVDLELQMAEKDPGLISDLHAAGALITGSYHNFSSTPDAPQLLQKLIRMQELGMDVCKLAVMPRSREDVLELMFASAEMSAAYADRPIVTMSMGQLGNISRVSGALTGSAVTFASLKKASAPGQIPARVMREMIDVLQADR